MKAIVTDLDRTLLRTDKTVSAYTLGVLRECRARGIRIMAASARPLRSIQPFDDLIGFDAVTATNGAVVRLPHQELHFGIPPQTGEQIIAALLNFPDVLLSIETSAGLYANRDIPVWQPVLYDDFPRLPDDVVLYKILASSTAPQLYDGAPSILPDSVYHTLAGHDLLQVMSRSATKWNGVRHMLSSFNIVPEEAVFFGDDNDDAEPIQRCGLGVAVANAIPAVLAAADHIAASHDADGVARFIATHILHDAHA